MSSNLRLEILGNEDISNWRFKSGQKQQYAWFHLLFLMANLGHYYLVDSGERKKCRLRFIQNMEGIFRKYLSLHDRIFYMRTCLIQYIEQYRCWPLQYMWYSNGQWSVSDITLFKYHITAWKVSKCGNFSGPYSVRMRQTTDQKKLSIWTLFTQCIFKTISHKHL